MRHEALKARMRGAAADAWHMRLYPSNSLSSTRLAGAEIVSSPRKSIAQGEECGWSGATESTKQDSPHGTTTTINGPQKPQDKLTTPGETLPYNLLSKYYGGLHGSRLHSKEALRSRAGTPATAQTQPPPALAAEVTLTGGVIPTRHRQRAQEWQELIPEPLLDSMAFKPLESSLLGPLPSAWKNDGSVLLWQRKSIPQTMKEQFETMHEAKSNAKAAAATARLTTGTCHLSEEEKSAAKRKANKVRAMYRKQRLDKVSQIHGFLSDPMPTESSIDTDITLERPSATLATFSPTIRHDKLRPQNIERMNPKLKLDQALKDHKHNRRSMHLLWARFKALCGLSEDPRGVSLEAFRKGVPALAAEDPLFVKRVYQLVDTDSSGAIDWEEFLATISALEQDSLENQCKFFFQIYDLDGDGLITRKDLETMFARSSMLLPAPPNCEDPQSMSEYADLALSDDSDVENSDVEVGEEPGAASTSSTSGSGNGGGSTSGGVCTTTQEAAWARGTAAPPSRGTRSRRKDRSKRDSDAVYITPTPLLLEACAGHAAPSERLLKALELACTAPRGLDAHTPITSLFSGKTGFDAFGEVGPSRAPTTTISADIDVGREPTKEELKQANKTAKRAVRTFVEKVFQRFGKSAAAGDGISLDEVIDFMKNLKTGEDVWTVFGRLMRHTPGATGATAAAAATATGSPMLSNARPPGSRE